MDTAATLTAALAAGRLALGLGFVAAPSTVGGRWIGRAAKELDTQVMIRAMGIREAALGAATLGALRSTGTSGVGFTVLTALGIAVDTVDALATAAAKDDVPRAGMSMAIALAAAATGAAVLALRDRDA